MPEPQLVDRFGQPVSSAALLEAPTLRRSSRKPPVFNPEPERLKALFKAADDGDPRELQQLCADLEGRDGHFGGVLETRRRAVTRLTWNATADTDDAQVVDVFDAVKRDILDAAWFRPMIRALLDAVVKGWSVCSITWATGDVWLTDSGSSPSACWRCCGSWATCSGSWQVTREAQPSGAGRGEREGGIAGQDPGVARGEVARRAGSAVAAEAP